MPDNQPSAAPPGDKMLDTVEAERARSRIVLVAIACAIASLMAVFLITAVSSGSASDLEPALAIATLAGGFIGLGQAPIVSWAIARMRLVVVVPLIYIIATIASATVMWQQRPVWGIFTFTFSVPLLALLARLLPDRRPALTNRCYACGYDLSGSTPDLCPECGAPQASAASTFDPGQPGPSRFRPSHAGGNPFRAGGIRTSLDARLRGHDGLRCPPSPSPGAGSSRE